MMCRDEYSLGIYNSLTNQGITNIVEEVHLRIFLE
jgi:hypothetical protein